MMSENYEIAAGRRTTLEKWIADALVDPDKSGKCSQMTLVHKIGIADNEIHTTKFVAGNTRTAKELAALFLGKAQTYAQDLPGSQTFSLLAWYGGPQPEARQPFTVTPASDTNGLATEGPSATGTLQQGMRLTEQIVQATMRERTVMFQQQQQIIDRLCQRLDSSERTAMDATEIVMRLMMEKVQLGHEQEMKKLEYERATATRAKLLAMVPPLTNTLTGKEIFPQSTADTALVETIAAHLKPETAAALAEHLPAELLGPLMARLSEIQRKKNAEDIEKARLLGMGTSKAAE